MAGLVAYASSDEEEDVAQEELKVPSENAASPRPKQHAAPSKAEKSTSSTAEVDRRQPAPETSRPGKNVLGTGVHLAKGLKDGQPHDDAPISRVPAAGDSVLIGPARPVSSNGAAALLPVDDVDSDGSGGGNGDDGNGDGDGEPPLSPYSAERALLRQLTLPRVPDFAIPGSPPGTPPPGLEALGSKFDTFLTLKRDKATHFNARLAQSGAMRNPAVMDKLMIYAGLDGAGTAQYGTVLPAEVWNPDAEDRTAPVFPSWAYRHPLRKVQEEQGRQRARAAGERVEFVAASRVGSSTGAATAAAATASATAASSGPVTGKRKSRFD